MPAGWIQIAAKGIQDEILTQNPETSFFQSVYTKKSDFTLTAKESPFINSVFQFGTQQICQLRKFGDVIKSITLKVTLPSTYTSGPGYSYPTLAQNFVPSFSFLDASYSVITSKSAKPSVLYYNTCDPSWLPKGVTIQGTSFKFATDTFVSYIGFKDTTQAGFWGFKNFIALKNGMYIYTFTGTSEKDITNSGWVTSYYPFFRPYVQNAGIRSIKSVDLYIGGQLIESVPSEYIMIYNDITIEEKNQLSVQILTGGTNVGVSPREYYIHIPFSATKVGLPICALYSQDIEVGVEFETFEHVINSNLETNQYTSDATFTQVPTFAGYTGTQKIFLVGNTINSVQMSELVGNVSATIAQSNVYLASGTNLFCFNTLSNTYSYFDTRTQSLDTCVGTGSTFNGVIQYTGNSFQNITENYDISFETCTPRTAKTLGTKTYIGCSNGFLIHDIVNLTDVSLVRCNAATSFTLLNSDVWFLNSNIVSIYKNSRVTNVYSVSSASLIDTYASNVYVFENSNVFVNGVQSLTLQYPTLATTSTSNGLYMGTTNGLYVYTLDSGLNGPFFGTKNIFSCYSSNGFVYFAYSQTPTVQSIVQFTDSPTFPPALWRENTVGSESTLFISSDLNSNIFVRQGQTLWKFSDDATFTGGQFSVNLLTDTAEKNIFYDGQSVYLFPKLGGNIIYKYDGRIYYNPNFFVDAGTINTYDSKITSFPFVTSNIFQYDSTGSFKVAGSFNQIQLQSQSHFTSSISTTNGLFVSSNNTVLTFNQTPTVSTPILCGTGGISYDGYVFTNARVSKINPLTNALDQISTLSDTFKLGTVAKIDSSTYLLVPADTTNVYSVSVLNGQVTKFDLGYPVPNHSNASITVASNVYIFPDVNESNIYVFNTITSQASRLSVPPMSSNALVYDQRYITAFNGTNIGYRLDTTLDTFTNPDAYSNILSNVPLYSSKPVYENSNVFLFSTSNVSVFRGDTQTFDTYQNPYQSVPVSAKNFGSNTFVIVNQSNVSLYSTTYNTVSNVMNIYKQPLSLEYNGLSNIFISYTDGTVGSFDYSSNDYTGTGYFVTDSLSLTQPITKVYANTILTQNTLTTLPDKTTVNLPSSNTFGIVTPSYIFPSSGSQYIVRSTLSPVTFTNFEETISDADGAYFCSGTTGNVYTIGSTYNSGLNGFIGVKEYSSNVYFIGKSNILAYFTPMNNFSNVYNGTQSNFFIPHSYQDTSNVVSIGNYLLLKSSGTLLNFSKFPESVENTYPTYTFLDPSSNSIGTQDGTLVLTPPIQYSYPAPSNGPFTGFTSDDSTFVFYNSQYIRWANKNGQSTDSFAVDFGNSTILTAWITSPNTINVIMYKTTDSTQVFLHRFIGNSTTPTITQLTREFNNPYLYLQSGSNLYGFQNNGGTNVFSVSTTGYVTGTVTGLSTLRPTQGLIYNDIVYLSSFRSTLLARVQTPITDPSSYQFIDFSTQIFRMSTLNTSNIVYVSNTSNSIIQYRTSTPFTVQTNWSTSTFAQPQSNTYSIFTRGNSLIGVSSNTIQYFNVTKPQTFSVYTYPFVSNVFDISTSGVLSLYSGNTSPTTVLFNTLNKAFSTVAGTPYVTTCVKGTPYVFSGPTSSVYDGRYIILSNGSQYDTLYNVYLQRNLGTFTGVSSYGSNVFLVNQDSYTRYDASNRSYTETQFPDKCYQLTWVTGAPGSLFTQCGSTVYKNGQVWVSLSSNSPSLDSIVIGSDIVFTTPGLISTVNTITPIVTFTPVSPKFGSRILSGSILPSSTDLTLWRSGQNFTSFTGTFGSTWVLGSNVYGITSYNRVLVYNSSFFSFTQISLPSNVNRGVYYDGQITYITPSTPFGTQISALTQVGSTVNALSTDGTYFTYNLNTSTITSTKTIGASGNYVYPFGTSVFVISPVATIRYPLSTAVVNQLDFSQFGTINGLVYDGYYVYTLSNPIYTVDTRTSVPLFVRLDRSQPSFTSYQGFFDGRFLNFTGTSNILFDLFPWTKQPICTASVISQSAYLTDKEISWMKSRPLDYLLTQIQKSTVNGPGYFNVDFFNPVKEILLVSNTFTEFEVYLNGNLKHQSGPNYLSNTSILQYHSRMPTTLTPVYPLSFCIAPESDSPSGHVNMSRIKEKVFHVTSNTSTIYALNYNILRVRDGIGGLVFNTRFN